MQEEKRPFVTITVGLREAKLLLAAALLLAVPLWLGSETLTLSTTYPSPAGIYRKLIATGDAVFGRDAGSVVLVPATNPTGSVVIGGGAPAAKLSVGGSLSAAGTIRFANVGAGPEPAGAEGAMYYNTVTRTFRGFSNGAWQDVGAEPTPGGLYGLCREGFGASSCTGAPAYCAAQTSAFACNGKAGCSWSMQLSCSGVVAPAGCGGGSASPCSCAAGYTRVQTGTLIAGFSACGSCGGSVVTGAGPVYSCMKN